MLIKRNLSATEKISVLCSSLIGSLHCLSCPKTQLFLSVIMNTLLLRHAMFHIPILYTRPSQMEYKFYRNYSERCYRQNKSDITPVPWCWQSRAISVCQSINCSARSLILTTVLWRSGLHEAQVRITTNLNKTNARMALIALTSLFILFISEGKKFNFNN